MKESLADKILGDQAIDYAINKIVQHDWDDPLALIQELADRLNIDLEEEYKETNIDKIHEIQNRSDKCYLVQTDCTDKQIGQLREQMKSELIDKYGRIEALIFIRNDVTEIEELPPEDVKASVKPWLQEQDEADN